MVDEEIQDVPTGPAGAPVNRSARREPEVIQAEIAARGTDEPPSDSIGPESVAESRPAPPLAPVTTVVVSFRAHWLASSFPRWDSAPVTCFLPQRATYRRLRVD